MTSETMRAIKGGKDVIDVGAQILVHAVPRRGCQCREQCDSLCQPTADHRSRHENAVDAAYNSLLPRLTFRIDAQFGRDFGQLQKMVAKLAEPQARQFENIFKYEVVGRLTPQGAATGQNFKLIDTEIGRLARAYKGSNTTSEKELGGALYELHHLLRANLTRANPHLAPELGRINQAYANYVRLAGC